MVNRCTLHPVSPGIDWLGRCLCLWWWSSTGLPGRSWENRGLGAKSCLRGWVKLSINKHRRETSVQSYLRNPRRLNTKSQITQAEEKSWNIKDETFDKTANRLRHRSSQTKKQTKKGRLTRCRLWVIRAGQTIKVGGQNEEGRKCTARQDTRGENLQNIKNKWNTIKQ